MMPLSLEAMMTLVGIGTALVSILGAWFGVKGRVGEAKHLAQEARRAAEAAHKRIDQYRDENVNVRLDIRELRTKLEALGEIRGSLEALRLRIEEVSERLSELQQQLLASGLGAHRSD